LVRKLVVSGLCYFLLICIAGVILRWKLISPILPGISFTHLLHAHSHVAFLGWVYCMLIAFFYQHLIAPDYQKHRATKIMYGLLHVSLIGMFFAFIAQGYGLYSIFFSSLQGLLSYVFAVQYRKGQALHALGFPRFLFHGAVLSMLISSLGPFGVGISQALGYKETGIPNLFLYFYLHLQYNGWFTLALMGCGYWLLNTYRISYSQTAARIQIICALVSVPPSYVGSILWFPHPAWLEWLGMLGSILSLVSACLYAYILFPLLKHTSLSNGARLLFRLAIVSFIAKNVLETAGAWPFMAVLVYANRTVIIGYLHLILLGFVTSFLLGLLFHDVSNLRKTSRRRLFPFLCLYTGSTGAMIVLLFILGLFQWIHVSQFFSLLHQLLLLSSIFVAASATGILWYGRQQKTPMR
jgi:hypothetical protein